MPLPDFLIIGAQKSGTSWLANQLGRNPRVFMPRDEIHYFDKAHNFSRGLEWYESHFAAAESGQLIGEKTPDYLWANGDGAEGHLPDVHRRLHKTLPQARLIIVLRNPVVRALSALTHLIRTRRVAPSHRVDDLLLGKKHQLIRGHGVVAKGFYYRQLRAYAELFDRRQFLILIFEEDIADQPGEGLRRCGDFLGIDPNVVVPSEREGRNASRRSRLRLLIDFYFPPARPLSRVLDHLAPAWKPNPSARTVDELYSTYAAENEKLFNWLERPIPASWGKEASYRAGSAGPSLPQA